MRKPFWEDTYSDMNASTFGGPSQEIRDIASQLGGIQHTHPVNKVVAKKP